MEKTYNPALIQRTQRYMETHSITLSYRLNGRQETASNAAAGTPRSVNTADIF